MHRVGFISLSNNHDNLSHNLLVTQWFSLRYPSGYHSVKPMDIHKMNKKNTLDPYRDRLLIIYKHNTQDNSLDIIGYLEYNSDNILQVVPEWFMEPKPMKPKALDGICIPWKSGNNDGCQCTIDDLCDRANWILNNYQEMDYRWNKQEWDYTTCKLLLMIGMFNESFHKKQLEKEKEYLLSKLLDYTRDDLSMKNVLSCSLSTKQLNSLLIDSTLIDRQSYHKEYPHELEEPMLWISVHISEVPNEIAKYKHLYKGGMMHLHRKDIPFWIWRKICLELHTRIKPMAFYDFLPEQLYPVLYHINSVKTSKRIIYKKRKVNLEISCDIEYVPPCIQSIINNSNHFPTDMERQQFVAILQKGGITLELVEKLLSDLNDKFPHRDGAIQLKKRWDYEAYYNKGYSPPTCEKTCFCPMTASTYDKRQEQCYKIYKDKFKPDFEQERWQTSHFYGPSSWLIWNNKKK